MFSEREVIYPVDSLPRTQSPRDAANFLFKTTIATGSKLDSVNNAVLLEVPDHAIALELKRIFGKMITLIAFEDGVQHLRAKPVEPILVADLRFSADIRDNALKLGLNRLTKPNHGV